MNTEIQTKAWVERFPGLSQLEASTKHLLVAGSQLVEITAGSRVFEPGKTSDNLLFLLSGTVRVQQASDNGREIVLYRAQAGESCVMTNACLFAYQVNAAEGIAETTVHAASIPKQLFDELLIQSAQFREFVLCAFSKRITDLFQVIDDLAFKRVDARLADKLIELADAQGVVLATHQKMSVELGTAREVVSRQLQVFQKHDWIETARGKIHLLNLEELSKLAGKN